MIHPCLRSTRYNLHTAILEILTRRHGFGDLLPLVPMLAHLPLPTLLAAWGTFPSEGAHVCARFKRHLEQLKDVAVDGVDA